jgi:hypothetical protein
MADTDDVLVDSGPTASPQDAQLDALSRSEDVSSYVAERQAQEAEEHLRGALDLKPEASADERQNRIDEALAKAREDTRQAREANGHLDQEWQQAQAEYQQQQAAEQQAAQQQALTQQYYEARGQCKAKAEQLRQVNPQAHATITQNLSILGDVLDDAQGQALEAALVMHPEAVWLLGMKLSNDSDGTTMADKLDIVRNSTPAQIFQAAAQGAQNLHREKYVAMRILQDRVQQGRRVSQAPPPMRVPRGGASVPKDMNQLAGKSDISDYVKWRRGQSARDDDR